MLENAVGICGANFGNMFLYEDNMLRTVAMHNAPEAYANARTGAPFYPPSDTALGRLVATNAVAEPLPNAMFKVELETGIKCWPTAQEDEDAPYPHPPR